MKTIFTLMLMFVFMTGIAQDKIYVHTATAANSSGNVTYLDHPDLNGQPNAGIVFVHAWNPNSLPAVYNNNVTGLWYDGARWAIYNEDSSQSIVDGSHYMVYIANNPSSVITHISDAGNQGTFGAYTTVIDNPLMNGLNPGPYAVMSHYYNPNSVYNAQVFGFYYDNAKSKRGIYDENATPSIPTGAAFKILINGEGGTRFTHTSTLANTSGYITTIDNPALNGNPNATFVYSHYYGVDGAPTQVDLDAVTSAYYDGSFWTIYCEDTTTPIQQNTAFDIIVVPQDTTVGITDNQLATEISMYPNPANTYVKFSTSKVIENITVFNMLGQEVLSVDGNDNLLEMDVKSLATGSYIAKVKAGNEIQALQFIKE